MTRFLRGLKLGAALFACAALPLAAQPAPPSFRLPSEVRPVQQSVEMRLDPAKESFEGTVAIDVEVREQTALVWLNAMELEVTKAAVTAGGKAVPSRVMSGGKHFVGLALEAPLARGPARLEIAYRGRINRTEVEGIFVQKEGGDFYLFTQFEAIAARRAFPCFDEPGFKIPWQVTLHVPEGLVALSNTSPARSSTAGGTTTVVFGETPPMPSYLVAVAVGPFDVVDAGPAGRKRTPVRIVVTKGRAGDAAWAVESTPRLLALLEDYFDGPLPYDKLDQVAVPGIDFAMEHPGLVTYGQALMVQKAGEETLYAKREFANVCAHEIAHMWFGNLVTAAWWDDLWLNEAFASWLATKIVDRYRPEWEVKVAQVQTRTTALRSDSLSRSRKIRQPVESEHDAANLFDSITYAKGESVLAMFEAWLGEETFRKGVRTFLGRHVWGNATAGDFLRALSEAAGRDVATPFSTFLDQSGAPLVTAEVRCDGAPRVVLGQKPYRPLGAPDAAKAWQVPVCVKHSPDPSAPVCGLLAGAEASLPLGSSCPAWDLPNAGMSGYFLTRFSESDALALLEPGRIGTAERVGLLGDLRALVKSGDLSAAGALAVVEREAKSADWQVAAAVVPIVDDLQEHVPSHLRPRFAAFVRGLYAERARAFGLRARPSDSEGTRLLRRSVVWRAGGIGEDPDVGRDSVAAARAWLKDPAAIDPDMRDVVLPLAARHGDRALFDAFVAALRASSDRDLRSDLYEALGSFRDPGLVAKALALTLDPGLDAREALEVVRTVARDPAARALAYAFTRKRHAELEARLPEDVAASLPFIAGRGLCSEKDEADLRKAFEPSSSRLRGGPYLLDQAIESIDLCIAERKVVQPSVARFLASR